jgi:MFS family permease
VIKVLLVLSAGLILASNNGARMTLGVFYPDILSSTMWSATSIGFTFGLLNLAWGSFSPIAGAIAEQKGYVKTLLAGMFLVSIGYFLASLASSPLYFTLSFGVVFGIAAGVTSIPVIIGGVGKYFPDDKSRSLVTGILTSLAASGMFILTPINHHLTSLFGWSKSFQILSVCFLITLPLAFIFLIPKPQLVNKKEFTKRKIKDVIKTAFQDKSYRYLILGFFVCGFHVALISQYLPIFTALKNIDGSVAATGLTLIGLCNMIGTVISGKVSGLIKKRFVLTFIYATRSIVIFLLMVLPTSPTIIIAFSCVIGLLWLSTVPPTSGIVANLFGTRYLSTLFGIVMVSHQLGAFFGSFIGGLAVDLYGSLNIAWILAILISLFSAVIHLPIKEKIKSEEVFA